MATVTLQTVSLRSAQSEKHDLYGKAKAEFLCVNNLQNKTTASNPVNEEMAASQSTTTRKPPHWSTAKVSMTSMATSRGTGNRTAWVLNAAHTTHSTVQYLKDPPAHIPPGIG